VYTYIKENLLKAATQLAEPGVITREHRWVPINVYCLLAKESKLPFSVSVWSKQTKVCHFRLLFAVNKRKLLFSISSIFRLYMYIYYINIQYAAILRKKSNEKQKMKA
jgi:hypothetical protein